MNILHALLRNFRFCFRNKALTFVNIFGLGVGLAVAMFLLVYLNFEFSYDKFFKDVDRTYRVLTLVENNGNKTNYPVSLDFLGERMPEDIPEVENAARLLYGGGSVSVIGKTERFGLSGYCVDSSFFKVFDFSKIYGELDGVFTDSWQCVLTQSASEKLFGAGINPVGQYVDADWGQPIKVMAVINDIPLNSHFKFEILQPMPLDVQAYEGLEFFTYVKFRKDVDIVQAIGKCNDLNKKLLHERFAGNWKADFGSTLEPLASLHISTEASYDLSPTNSFSGLFFVILIGLLVLGIAISNFISLFMIQGEKRSMEVGIRKAGGASRLEIVGMLLGETFQITFLSFLFALALFCSLSGYLSDLLNLYIPDFSWHSGNMCLGFLILYIITALLAGSYPAWNLSRSQPAELIRKTVVRKSRLTVASVIVQFSVVIFCVSALWIVIRQLDYVLEQPFGFETENMIVCYAELDQARGESVRNELLKYPSVLSAGFGTSDIEDGGTGEGIGRIDREDQTVSVREYNIGNGYLETLEIPLLAGKGFSGQIENDRSNIILAESTVKALQLEEPVIGKKILRNGAKYTVIGVARDCRHGSAKIRRECMTYVSWHSNFRKLYIHFRPEEYGKARKAVVSVLKTHFPENPVHISLLKDRLTYFYEQDRIVARTLKFGASLAVLLALLGLVALCGFVAQQKSKEISIRRVAGANIDDIVTYMLRYILWRVVPAVPVGIVASYLIMKNWLNGFQFAMVIPWWIYGVTIITILLAVAAVVVIRSWKAATANPVDALKSE